MTVFITGASRGIGAQMAKLYAQARVDVIGTSRAGGDGLLAMDVSDRTTIEAAAKAVEGPIDLLVCNAGVFLDRPLGLGDHYNDAVWSDSFAVNVTGVFHTINTFLPKLASNGKIAIISSQMGSSERASGGGYVYRASKAAVLNLGRNLAVDLKPRGIAVGIYHPGWVITDMGGSDAAITADMSAKGLVARFDALDLDNTGCFENYDGSIMPF